MEPSGPGSGNATELQHLVLLINNLQDAFIMVDQHLEIKAFNNGAAQGIKLILGKELVQGKHLFEYAMQPGNLELLQQYLQQALGGQQSSRELHFDLPQGPVALYVRYLPAFDEKGAVVGCIIAATNITRQRQKEQSLLDSEQRWRFALEGSNQGVWDWDIANDRVFYSESWYHMLGYTPERMGNAINDYEQLLHPDDQERMRRLRAKHLGGSATLLESEFRFLDGNGHYRWILSRGMIMERDHAGRPVRMIGTHADITGRKLVEEKYKAMFYKNPMPMWTFDRQTLRFLDVNESAVNLYGYSAEEFRNMTILDIRPEEERSFVLHDINRNNDISGVTKTWRHKRKDGVLLWVNITGFTFQEQDRPITLITAEDVSEKVRADAELRASSERFHYVMNATNDIVWDWQVESEQVLWSVHYQDIMGWELPAGNQLPLNQYIENIHPDDRERVVDSRKQAVLDADVLWENAYRFCRGDGTYAYVLDKAFILRNNEGVAYRMIGAMHDITTEQYQQELQELELRVFALASKPDTGLEVIMENIAGGLEQLHEHLRVAVLYFPEGDGVQCLGRRVPAGAAEWMVRFAREQKNKWLNSPLRKGLTTHSLELADRKLLMNEWQGFEARQVLSLPAMHSGGQLLASMLVFIGNNRGLVNTEWNALYRLQNLMRILAVQQLALDQIRQANERFDKVQQATHDLIWDWDIATGSFFRSPEAVRRIYGEDPEGLTTNVHDWLNRIHPEDLAKVEKVIGGILAGTLGDNFDVEYRICRKDGVDVYLYDRGIIIRDVEGKPIRMIGAAQDVTERKRLEQELLQQELDRQRVISQATIDTQEQERAEIGRELHDNVNQILTTTKLYLELAQTNSAMKDELVLKACTNIIHVINEIRQLSRSLMDPSIGDLGLVASIRDLAANINLARKVRIRFSADEALDELLDERRRLMVFRITQEALSNVIRHAKATDVQVKLKIKGADALLQITDNGIGFDPDAIRTGIGLKNIRNRVYLAHGNLQIVAKPGAGCTLKIVFPIHQKAQ